MSRSALPFSRWWLVVVAALAMGTAGFYQFGWSSIRVAAAARTGASEATLGTVFTVFVVFQTVGQFPAGWVRDRYGPRLPLLVGAAFLAGGFIGVGLARSEALLLVAYGVGGLGVAIAYTVAVNTPVKWFTERRGLATGMVTMAFGGGSFLLIPVVRPGLEAAFRPTMLALGGLAGGIALLAAVVLRDVELVGSGPNNETGGAGGDDETDGAGGDDETDGAGGGDETDGAGGDDEMVGTDADDDAKNDESDSATSLADTDGEQYTWRETVRTWQFWLLYAVFVVVNGSGLMLIGKVVTFASELGLPAVAGTAAASLVALGDATGILVVGGVSDRLGRRRSVAASLSLAGLAIVGAVLVGRLGLAWGFVALVFASAFFRSPPFALFPSIVGDYYGRAYSSENYAALYTAKLFGGVFGGSVASLLVVSLGWSTSFALAGGVLFLAGVALLALRPV